jgi:hypothetical protein
MATKQAPAAKERGPNKQPGKRLYLPAHRSNIKDSTEAFRLFSGKSPTAEQRSALNYFTQTSTK